MLNVTFIEKMKQKLLSAKQQLEADLSGLKPHQELGEDLDSSVQEVEDDEVSRNIISRMQADLVKIDKALEKIENGSYGTDDSGNLISEERLRAMPWADKAI